MYNNFSSKKTKKVISALLASALVVTSGPITADAATAKVVGIKKTFTVSASATNKVTGLSKAEKKVVKVTKKGKKFTIKGLKAGKATFKIGKKSYTVKVGATTVKAAKTKLTLTKGKKATLKFTTKSGNGDTLTFKASNKNVTLAKKSAKIAKSAASVKATAKKAGKTTITATSKATGKKATVTVTVKAATTPATATPGTSNTPSVTTGAATNTPEATATATATATASGSATNTPDVTATPVATATATPVATGSATNTPEATEVPTEAPTKAPEVVTGGTITVTGTAVTTDAAVKVVSGTTVVYEGTVAGLTAKKLEAGTYVVTVSKDGYEDATTSAVVVDKENTTVTVELVETATVVSKVYDVTTTTVSVEMKKATETTPAADTFKVLVNGTANAVKTVTKVAGDASNTKYILTLTDSLNKKEGTLTVNGTAATLAGSDFDFDFKAPTASVNVINSTTVDVVFSEKVSKAQAETILASGDASSSDENYIIQKISDRSNPTINAAVLQADGKTVRLTLDASTKLTSANYILLLNNGNGSTPIVDLNKNALAAASEVTFAGTAEADTEAPEMISASYDSSEDKLYFNFSEAMAGTFTQAGFSITDGKTTVTLNANDTGAWSTNKSQLVVTLGSTNKAALKAMDNKKTVTVKADSVKDAASNGIGLVNALAVSEKTTLKTASYDEATNYLTLTFSNPVDVKSLVLGDITLGSSLGNVRLDSKDTVKTTTNGETVQIELAKDAALDTFEGSSAANRNISLTAGNFADTNKVGVAATTNATLTYVEDTTAPTIESISVNKRTHRLTITFSEPVQVDDAADSPLFDGSKVEFTDGDFIINASTCEQVGGSSATSSKVVSFVSDGTVDNDSNAGTGDASGYDTESLTEKSALYLTAEGAFKDDAGNKLAAVTKANALPITYVDQSGPQLTRTATNNGTDSVILLFNKAITKETAETIANYSVYMTENKNVKVAVSDAKLYADGTKVRLKFASTPTLGIGYTVVASNIVDTKGNPIQTTQSEATFTGVSTKDTTKPKLDQNSSVEVGYTDTDGSKSVTAGDKLTLTFDEVMDIDFTKVDASDFALTGGASTPTLGTAPSFAYGTSRDQVVITLGANPSLDLGTTTINVAATNDLKDEAGNSADENSGSYAKVIPAQGAAPEIKTAVYEDTNKDGKVSAGDKITFTYTQDLDATGITNLNSSSMVNDFAILSGKTFGYQAKFESANSNQIVVTLGDFGDHSSAPANDVDYTGTEPIVNTTTFDEGSSASSNIKDTWGVLQDASNRGSVSAVKLTSEDKTAPTIAGVAISKKAGNVGTVLEAGDKVVITLSEAVGEGTFVAGNYILYSGATPKAYTASDSTKINIVGNVVTIEIATGDGWINTTISGITTFNFAGGATSLVDASQNEVVPTTGFGVAVTK